ncbi:MAG: fasciclin domain-containing protein [Bacteroidales bacterium]
MKKIFLFLACILISLSCKKESSDNNTPSTSKTDYDQVIDFLKSKGNYTHFLNGLERISAKESLKDKTSTLFAPTDEQLLVLMKSRGYKQPSDVPIEEARMLILNHFLLKKLTKEQLKEIEKNELETQTQGKVLTTFGSYSYLTGSLKLIDDKIAINNTKIGDKIFENKSFIIYSAEKALTASALGELVSQYNFYNEIIKGKSTFDLLDAINKSKSSTIIGLTNDGTNDFIKLIGGADKVTASFATRFAQNAMIPDVKLNIDDVFGDKIYKAFNNELKLTDSISSQLMSDALNVWRKFSTTFTDPNFKYKFFTLYYTPDPIPMDRMYTIADQFHVTENGTLIVFLGSKDKK